MSYTRTYISIGEFETFPRDEFNLFVKRFVETTKKHSEKKRTDFGDYTVYVDINGIMAIHEADKENPRLTVYTNPPKTYTLENRVRKISKDSFNEAERLLRKSFGHTQSKPNGNFGRYFLWDNLGYASKCILEDRIKRLTIDARDEEDIKRISTQISIRN